MPVRVALLTTWNERCGIAEYATNLVKSLPQVEWLIIDRKEFAPTWLLQRAHFNQYDILHVNYEPGLFGWLNGYVLQEIRRAGKRLVLTLHTSQAGDNRSGFTANFDRVVVHEATTEGFTQIPLGIPAVAGQACSRNIQVREGAIGTVGFPFPWKGFHQVAQAASLLGRGCVVIAPESPHADTNAMEAVVMAAQPQSLYIKVWLTQGEVIDVLGQCAATVFAYAGGNYGISAAVRLGLAAGRPIVVTRHCRQFRDLLAYEDEIGLADSQDPAVLAESINGVLGSGKKPSRILKDMSWEHCGARYAEVYQSLV